MAIASDEDSGQQAMAARVSLFCRMIKGKWYNVGSLAAMVGSQPLVFAPSVGSKPPLFASPNDRVCGP
jgi:hypothetical protein